MDGFFTEGELAAMEKPVGLALCGKCGNHKDAACHTPKMKPSGLGRRRILVVGSSPTAREDEAGVQFLGDDGQKVRDTLKRNGIDPNRDCWMVHGVICKEGPTDEAVAVEYCRPNLINTIKDLQPDVIIPMGRVAIQALMGWLFPGYGMETWNGWRIPSQQLNAWVCPTFHPWDLRRSGSTIMERMFEAQVKAACNLDGPPWDIVPDYKSQVEILGDDAAASKLEKVTRAGGLVAFDYETNMLKPDSEKGRIVSAAVCWEGAGTFSFLMRGRAVEAMRALLKSDRVRKIAANLKFEERWSRAKLKTRVVGWHWDTMIAGHVLDNRPSIVSLKFQAFVLLGQPDYDSHVHPFLKRSSKEEGGYAENAIRDLPTTDLLTYNGLDALLEFEVAKIQMRQLGVA